MAISFEYERVWRTQNSGKLLMNFKVQTNPISLEIWELYEYSVHVVLLILFMINSSLQLPFLKVKSTIIVNVAHAGVDSTYTIHLN